LDEHEDAAASARRLRLVALRALARKEHGATELQRKLEQKGFPADQVGQLVASLQREGLLNDHRYVESFIRQHAQRGQGPARIRAELRMQGIDPALIGRALAAADVDWAQLACEVRRKRFGAAIPRTAAERAKQGRFLQYRGFDSEQIRAAFRGVAPHDESAVDGSDAQDEY
jgi:regulatory protein